MIQLSRNYSLPERDEDIIPIKVIGIGGAGSNVLDRVVLDGLDKADLVAANTDVQSLASSVAANKVQLGRSVTRGLGTGGDPELGFESANEARDEIQHSLGEARLIFICVGLGGGTGSGAAPVIADLARESGAMVITLATMPFTFEGKRRKRQAEDALARLQQISNAVICFDNDRLGDVVAPKAGIHQAFAAADVTISQSVRSIISLIQRPGLIRIGFDDLLAALKNPNARCLFGYGESDSDNRAHDALTQALKSPLMDRGRLLGDAVNVLVQVAGGPGVTLSEVEALMQDLNRHIGDETQILFGTAVDGRMGNRLAVTIISSLAADGEVVQKPLFQPPILAAAPIAHTNHEAPAEVSREEPNESLIEKEIPASEPVPPILERPLQTIDAVIPAPHATTELPVQDEPESELIDEPPRPAPAPAPVMIEPEPPQPRVILPKKKPTLAKEPKPAEKIVHAKQEVMQFESITRGRFEKSEPTIVEGQDLDVPTFMRKNVRVK